jgi:hypothetical protein
MDAHSPTDVHPTDVHPNRGRGSETGANGAVSGVAAALGYVLATAWVLVTLLAMLVVSTLGNCRWGLFGTETGPGAGAASFSWSELGLTTFGGFLACLPWLLIARRTRHRAVRVASWLIVCGTAAVVMFGFVAPQIVSPEGYWAAMCS